MATTTTTFQGLIKPTPGTREPVKVADLNANADHLDKTLGPVYSVRAEGALADGADDGPGIRAAVAKAALTGGTVDFVGGPATVYSLGASGATYSVTLPSNVTLRSHGATIRRRAGNTEKLLGAAVALSDVVIRDLVIDNQDVQVDGSCLSFANGCNRISCRHVRFTRLANSGPAVSFASGTTRGSEIRLVDCAFERTLANGTASDENVITLQIFECNRVYLTRCRFSNCNATYIAANPPSSTLADPCRHVHVRDCVWENVKETCLFLHSYTGAGMDHVYVTGCTFFNVGKEIEKGALAIGQGGGTMTNVVIRGNTIRDFGYLGSSTIGATPNTAAAIIVNGVTGLVVEGNRIDGSRADGTYPGGANIGIWLQTKLSDVVLRGNAIRNCAYAGIRVAGVAGAPVTAFVIQGNVVRDCCRIDNAATRYAGILVEDYANHGEITGNVCLNNGSGVGEGAGIGFWTPTSITTISDILVAGNHAYDTNAGGGGKFQQFGIRVGFTAGAASGQPSRIMLLGNVVGNVDVAGGNEQAGLFYQTTVDLGYVVADNPGADSWLSYTPTWTGFTATVPTVTSRYRVTGKVVTWTVYASANGTSNATTLTATLPVPARAAQTAVGLGVGTDNGVTLATPVRIDLSSTTVATFYTTPAGGVWTNTGSKAVYFTIVYEAAA